MNTFEKYVCFITFCLVIGFLLYVPIERIYFSHDPSINIEKTIDTILKKHGMRRDKDKIYKLTKISGKLRLEVRDKGIEVKYGF
ncbi:hypothetical protein HN803_02770 [candidate division WWE3 bacterium]|jgi:hypothetical protein|nr:hypothetical protein [candidate division WWE3 bacterium]